jgi:hypothetical protein
MDYDHPTRERRKAFKPFHVSFVVVAVGGLLWVGIETISFGVRRLRAKTETGRVIGYERAGGKERLRVQVMRESEPGGFLLLDPDRAWPRYAPGQTVALLTWNSTNRFGQRIQQNAAYAPLNYWLKPVVIALVALGLGTIGAVGLTRIARLERGR